MYFMGGEVFEHDFFWRELAKNEEVSPQIVPSFEEKQT